MGKETKPKSEFIKVICMENNGWWSRIFFKRKLSYLQYHLVAMISEEDATLLKKLNYWKESEAERPPNILLVGIDFTSRLNFRRFMNDSVNILETVIQADEMLGYTKSCWKIDL